MYIHPLYRLQRGVTPISNTGLTSKIKAFRENNKQKFKKLYIQKMPLLCYDNWGFFMVLRNDLVQVVISPLPLGVLCSRILNY